MSNRSELIKKWAKVWSSGEVDTLLAFYTDDVEYTDVTFGTTFNGTEEFRGFGHTMYEFSQDLKLETHAEVIDGDNVAFEWTMSGTQHGDLGDIRAEGRPWAVKGMSRAKFRGDQMSVCIDYWDMVTVRECLTGHAK